MITNNYPYFILQVENVGDERQYNMILQWNDFNRFLKP